MDRSSLAMVEDVESNDRQWGEFDTDRDVEFNLHHHISGDSSAPDITHSEVELYLPTISNSQPIEIILDPLVLQTIELHRFKRFVADPANDGIIPEIPSLRKRSSFGAPLPDLSKRDVHEVTRKACAALCAQVGFQDADAEALEVLTDVTKERIEKMFIHLQHYHERRLLARESAFSTAVQQMFQAFGIHSVLELREFYDRRVRSFHDRLLAECESIIINNNADKR